ncbi:GNAT family N-acetyltransferase [Streptomyces sp. DT2A-34]|uniref:GNAT family N-acetyltransferase n=1 Tax=Streptomyces sp. DT2A-34 TaxID=3051182 RepID=UPI00265C72B8|nr:GNAT family N-acetyltransferase [Streptomyces sp. DT2A-34]MDO0915132.1 GNAT family N-acetyltransferase [Streptomyces sp. DT2A-34]
MTPVTRVRRYRPEDRDAIEDICVRTAHEGGDSRPHYEAASDSGSAAGGIFPTTFALPYVVLEPDLAFVLDDGTGRAVGYILGAADTPRFVEDYRTKWLPSAAERYPEPSGSSEPSGPPSTPDEAMIRLLHHPERMLVPEVAAYPAHLHIDLLPAWQGRGHGRTLMRTLMQALQDQGAAAVHLSMVTANTPARAFYDRLGFHEIAVPDPGPVTCLGRTTKDLGTL